MSQKIESVYFCSCPQAKLSPRFFSLSLQAGENNPFPLNNAFCLGESRKDYEAEKIIKIKLITGFDKSHHLCNHFTHHMPN